MQLSEEQHELQRTVRRLLERTTGSGDTAALRRAVGSDAGYDVAVWRRLTGEVGVAALAVPEHFGGAGFTLLESLLVLEELGRTLTPSPMLGSAVLATQALLLSADKDACNALLPGIAAGEKVATLAWAGPKGCFRADGTSVTACPTSDGECTLTGRSYFVLDGDVADHLVVAARSGDGLGLFVVDAHQEGVERDTVPGMDLTRRLTTVTLDHCSGRLLGSGSSASVLSVLRDLACVALAMEQAGAAARCLETTVDHTKQREQFGRPIGSFQAVKHRLADLFVLVETTRSAAYAAARSAADALAIGGDTEHAALAHWASLAKVYCSEALFAVASEAVQLHGGIAITWEHDAQLYLKRAHGSAQLFGAPRRHVARLGERLLPA